MNIGGWSIQFESRFCNGNCDFKNQKWLLSRSPEPKQIYFRDCLRVRVSVKSKPADQYTMSVLLFNQGNGNKSRRNSGVMQKRS